MTTLGIKPGATRPGDHHIRVLMAALPRRTEWNLSRLKVFADMIGAKLAGPDLYVDQYGWYYKLLEN